MSPRLHPEFLPTVGVLLVVAFLAGALLSLPDPFTQFLYAGPGAGLAGAWLGWGRGRERLGFRSRNP